MVSSQLTKLTNIEKATSKQITSSRECSISSLKSFKFLKGFYSCYKIYKLNLILINFDKRMLFKRSVFQNFKTLFNKNSFDTLRV